MKFSISILCLSLAISTYALPSRLTPANPLKIAELRRRDELERRQLPPLIPLAVGVWMTIAGESIGESAVGAVANSLTAAFGQDPAPWDSESGHCIISFSTHGGAECSATVTAKDGTVSEHIDNWNVCPWINPENTNPPVQYFTDPGIGDYSIRFTATDEVAWDEIAHTDTCVAEGLCNPRLTFYRKDFSIILDTWLSQGDRTQGGYFGDFGGLCGNGPVKDQFTSGGVVMGYDCAIPCEDQGTLPSDG